MIYQLHKKDSSILIKTKPKNPSSDLEDNKKLKEPPTEVDVKQDPKDPSLKLEDNKNLIDS